MLASKVTRALAIATLVALAVASLSTDPLREYAATGAYVGVTATAIAALVEVALRSGRGAQRAPLPRDRR